MFRKKRYQKIERILLVRPDVIGDVVLLIPSIIALRKHYPNAHISVMLRSYTVELLKNHPVVNEVIVDPFAEGKVKTWVDFKAYVKLLKSKKFDAVIHFFHKSSYAVPTAIAAILAGIPIRIGDYSKPLLRLLYTDGIVQKWQDFSRHQAEHNLDLVHVLGVDISDPEISIVPSNENRLRANEILKEYGINSEDCVAGIHLGTGGGNKPWYPEGYAGVINKLSDEFKIKWVITGGKHEEAIAQRLLKETRQSVMNLVGKTSLGELMAIIGRYNLYISVDTGPLHIAAASKVPVLLISPTRTAEPTRWGPWDTRQVVVRKPVDCNRPCMCPEDHCLKQTTVEEVAAAASDLINGGGNATRDEIFRDWCRKSFNILVLDREDSKGIVLAKALKQQGLNVIYATPKRPESNEFKWEEIGKLGFGANTFKQLLRLIITHNIRIIHFADDKIPFWFKLLRMWLSSYMPTPPIVVGASSKDFNCVDWITIYVQEFRK